MLTTKQIAELEKELRIYLGGCFGGKAEDIPATPDTPGDFGDRGNHKQEVLRVAALNSQREQFCSQVQAALERIRSDRYSDKCAVCGEENIPFARLMATPWAVTHIRRDGKCVVGVIPVES